MKRSAIVCVLLAAATVHADPSSRALDLEPCINGGVSASGSYVDQLTEDRAGALQSIMLDDEYALEPCINGGVSALGTLPQEPPVDARLVATGAGSVE